MGGSVIELYNSFARLQKKKRKTPGNDEIIKNRIIARSVMQLLTANLQVSELDYNRFFRK